MNSLFFPLSRHQQLLHSLPHTMEKIQKGELDQIPSGFLADYLALHWLIDRGQGLRLTATGEAMCQKLKQFKLGVSSRHPVWHATIFDPKKPLQQA